MRLRKWLGSLAALACAGWIGTASATDLTFLYMDPDAPDIRAALDVFEKANPGIRVKIVTASPADALPNFLREAAVGSGPDVMQAGFVWVKDIATAGAALPLDDVIGKPAKDALADFIALDLATGRDGKVYGLPWTVDTFAMVYRTDLLEKAGITSIPKTWDEFRAASRKVHAATGKAGFQFGMGSAPSNSIWFAANYWWWSHGQALVVKKPEGGFAPGVTVPEVAAAMRYFAGFLQDGETPKGMLAVSNWADPAVTQPMVAGEAMATLIPPANFKQMLADWRARNPNGGTPPLTSALVPADKAGSITHLGGRSLVINANTADPKAAWKLVQFLATQDVFARFYKAQMPAQKTLLKTIDFGPALAGYAEQLQRARTWGPYSEAPIPIATMWTETGRDFGSVFIGEATPEAAAQRLLDVVTKGLK